MAALLLIFGVKFTADGLSDIIKLSGNIKDFNSESIADIKKGDIVAGYIANIYDCYAGETTTNTTMGIETSSYTSREYFIMPLVNDEDLARDMFVSVSVSKEADRDIMYRICDATYEYLDGNEDAEFPEMAFVAKAEPLDDELKGYLLEWFEDVEYFEGGRAEAEAHIIPYDLVLYNSNSAYISLAVGLLFIGILIVVAAIFIHKNKTKNDSTQEMQQFDGFRQVNNDDSGMEGAQSGSVQNGFAESQYAPSYNVQDIPQPVQPDEFFARPERKPKTSDAPKAPKAPEPHAAEKTAAPAEDHSNEINTDSLDTEKALYEQEQSVAANRKPIQGSEEIETDSLDTEKALYEQEQSVAANRKPVQGSEEIETDSLDTEKALYEQEQSVAANRKPIQGSEEIETDSLDTENALYEQEQSVAANRKPIQGSEEIDTSSLDMGELGYFDKEAEDENDEDIFDFTNELDYEVGDASEIELT